MKYVIYGLIVLVVLYGGRNYIKGWILSLKKKINKKNLTIKEEFVYTPILSSRVFTFSIEVSEVGNGRAKLTIVKGE